MMKELPKMPLLPEARIWWLVKTTMAPDGKLEAEIYRDKITKQVVVIQSDQKPMDESYGERNGNVIYWTYHETYDAAAEMIEQVGCHADPYFEPLRIDTKQLAAQMMGGWAW